MGAHYLIDQHGSPITTADIHDVRYPANGQSVLNGNFIVRVPDGVAVRRPSTVADLLTKKYQGLLARYAGFTRIAYDDLIDTTSVDLTYVGTRGQFGDRNQISLNTSGGAMQSTTVALTGPAPSQVVVTWEAYEVTDSDPKTGRMVRTYVELPSSGTYSTVQVSFNGGGTWNAAVDGGVLNIPLASQGTNFIIRITNPHVSKRVRIGSWAVVY